MVSGGDLTLLLQWKIKYAPEAHVLNTYTHIFTRIEYLPIKKQYWIMFETQSFCKIQFASIFICASTKHTRTYAHTRKRERERISLHSYWLEIFSIKLKIHLKFLSDPYGNVTEMDPEEVNCAEIFYSQKTVRFTWSDQYSRAIEIAANADWRGELI